MQKISNFITFVVVPFVAIGFMVFHYTHKQKKKTEKVAAREMYLGSPDGYKKNFVDASLGIDLERDGKVYLKGKVKNKGSRTIDKVTITLRPAIKGMKKPSPISIGPVSPNTDKSVYREIVANEGKQYVEYYWSISDVTLK